MRLPPISSIAKIKKITDNGEEKIVYKEMTADTLCKSIDIDSIDKTLSKIKLDSNFHITSLPDFDMSYYRMKDFLSSPYYKLDNAANDRLDLFLKVMRISSVENPALKSMISLYIAYVKYLDNIDNLRIQKIDRTHVWPTFMNLFSPEWFKH